MDSFLLSLILPFRYDRHEQVSIFSFRFVVILCFYRVFFFFVDRGVWISGFCSRLWLVPESDGQVISRRRHEQELQIVSEDSSIKMVSV